ncbi:MAG TPA: molybdopterin-dependent oxidoreductase, partial [Anaerolineales bacterium]|nr:molybdopterin-dependent oxidoreductase [Anaerolineales bacterium]
DIALVNGLMYIILEKGWEDKAFIAERTENFDEFKATVMNYPPDKVAEITGIPVEKLYEAAEIIVKNSPMAVIWAMGITQHIVGVRNVMDLANLQMLLGNMGKAGGGVNPLRGQNNVQGACDMGGLPNVYPGYQVVTSDEVREKFAKAWGPDHGPQTMDDGHSSMVDRPSSTIGLTSTEMIPAAGAGKIRALFIMGENPMMADPDINHVRHCLENTEFLVVQDIFLTETAQMAHVVLPAASFAEKDGTFTNTDRRVQRVRKAIEPIGDSKPDWLITCELARKMGAKGFDFESPKAVMEEINRVTPIFGGITYERLEELGSLQWPCPTVDHPGTPYLHKGKFSRGLGKFFPIEFKEAAELPDKEYPFLLTTGRIMFHYHTGSMTRRSPKLHSELPEGYIEINVEDAKKIGLNGHKHVRVTSRRGQIEIGVRTTGDIRPGVVFIPFHFAEAPANALTNSALDPVSKTPEYKVCAVKIDVLS